MADEPQQWPGTPIGGARPTETAPQWPGTPVAQARAPEFIGEGGLPNINTGPNAAAAVNAPMVAQSPSSAFLQSHHDAEAAALQRVNPNALSKYFPSDPANKPTRLGEIEEFDWGPAYKGPSGDYLRINPQSDFIARDPDSGRLAAYTRTPQTDESALTSASRLVMPGLAVGPVSSSIRGVPQAAEAVAAGLPHSSAGAPLSVTSRLPSGAIGTPVGAELATQRAADAVSDAAAFARQDVRPPPIAFMQGPMAQVGKQVSEIPFIGSPIKNSLDESLKGLATATENVASRYGSASTPETAGAAIQQGIERFRDARPADIVERALEGYTPEQLSRIIAAPARETSMKTKQAALYQRAWSLLPESMQSGRTIEGLPRIQGGMPETRAVLEGIEARNMRMINSKAAGADSAASPIASSGLLGRMIDAITTKGWTAALQTQRDIRSEFRRLASGMADTEKNTLRLSDIERVQSAATRDMISMLERNAEAYRGLQRAQEARSIDRAILEFRRADKFTRLAAERMEIIERLFNAPSAESLYRNIMNAALSKGKGDLAKLRILTKTLRPEEMNDVAAAVMRQLGEPIGSARGSVQEIGFSPSSALTRWNNMSPEARALIFGHEHAQALDDWFRITNRLANVEALANTSRSGTYLTNAILGLGSAAMAFNGHTALLGAALMSGGALSLLLSRPSYVKWVTQYAKLRAAALRAPVNSTAPRMAVLLNQLNRMAIKDPALIPVQRAIAAENGVGPQPDQQQPTQH